MSVMQAIRLIGPASGFMLSSFCLRMYENPFSKKILFYNKNHTSYMILFWQ